MSLSYCQECSTAVNMPSEKRSVSLSAYCRFWLCSVCLLFVLAPLAECGPVLSASNQRTLHRKGVQPVAEDSGSTIPSVIIRDLGVPSQRQGSASQGAVAPDYRISAADILGILKDAPSLHAGRHNIGQVARNEVPAPAPALPFAPSRPKIRSQCTATTKQVTMQLPEGCQYKGRQTVQFKVRSCSGRCKVTTELQALLVGQEGSFVKQQKCKCCQPKQVEYQSVTATCQNNEERVFKIASAVGCRCKKCSE